MRWFLLVYPLVAAALLIGFCVRIDRRSEKQSGLSNFPLKGMPTTNGAILGIGFMVLVVVGCMIALGATPKWAHVFSRASQAFVTLSANDRLYPAAASASAPLIG